MERNNDAACATTYELDPYNRLAAAVGKVKRRGRIPLEAVVAGEDGGELVSVIEAGERLGEHPESVRTRAKRRGFSFVVVGGGKRLRASDLERLAA